MANFSLGGIYPEIAVNRRTAVIAPVIFPDTCPVCDAPKISERAPEAVTRTGDCTYACGGGYNPKSQISVTWATYWGACPVNRTTVHDAADRLREACDL